MFELLDPEQAALVTYLNRAILMFNNAVLEGVPPAVRTTFFAFCLYSCQSLREALLYLAELRSDNELKLQIGQLPYASLIEAARNLDVHGRPLHVCDMKFNSQAMVSGQRPMQFTSSHGVAVNVQMEGPKPKVRLSPKDQEHGKFTPGDALFMACQDGRLSIGFPGEGKAFDLEGLLREHIGAANSLVKKICSVDETENSSGQAPE